MWLPKCQWSNPEIWINWVLIKSRRPHICVSKSTIIGSNNGLSLDRCQVIILNNAGILLFGLLGTNFGEILIEIHTLLFEEMHLKMSSWQWRQFCVGLNVLTTKGIMHVHTLEIHMDNTWWRHQMETFSALLAICAGNSRGNRWIPRTKASYAELWCFLWSASE